MGANGPMACWALSVLWELRASCRKKAVTESLGIASKRGRKYLLVFNFPALGRKHECQPPDLALVCCILLHPKSMIAHPIRALPRAPIALYAIAIGR